MLLFVPICYKNLKMFNRAVDNCAHALEFVLECCNTQEMCDKVVVLAILYLIPYLIDIRLKKRVI